MDYQIISRGAVFVVRQEDMAHIPVTMQNKDYRKFLNDWEFGAVLTDEDGNPVQFNLTTAVEKGLVI